MNTLSAQTNNEYVLLMTACIEPKNLNRPSFRATPHVRLEDYKKAFEYWLNYPDKRIKAIVFAENSGYELTELKEIADRKNIYKRNIEFLQFEETERLPGDHYGYSDMEIIDHAIYSSKLIISNSIIIKTTGRLYFPKLNKLLDLQDKNQYDFFSDVRDFSFRKFEKHYIVTTLLIIKPAFYKQHLYDIKRELTENTASHMETLYFKILRPLRQANRIQLGFPFLISTIGIGAHSNSDYASLKKRIEAIGLLYLEGYFLPHNLFAV